MRRCYRRPVRKVATPPRGLGEEPCPPLCQEPEWCNHPTPLAGSDTSHPGRLHQRPRSSATWCKRISRRASPQHQERVLRERTGPTPRVCAARLQSVWCPERIAGRLGGVRAQPPRHHQRTVAFSGISDARLQQRVGQQDVHHLCVVVYAFPELCNCLRKHSRVLRLLQRQKKLPR